MTGYEPKARNLDHPRPVRLALRVLWTSVILGALAHFVITRDGSSPEGGASDLLYGVVAFFVCAFILIQLGQQKSWARVVTLVFVFLQVPLAAIGSLAFAAAGSPLALFGVAQSLLGGAGIYFLLQSETREWFAAPARTETTAS